MLQAFDMRMPSAKADNAFVFSQQRGKCDDREETLLRCHGRLHSKISFRPSRCAALAHSLTPWPTVQHSVARIL